jgi:hypothetical protein
VLPTQLGACWATPSHLGAKGPRVTNAKYTILAKLKCSRFVVLYVVLKLSLSQTQLRDIIRITQSHKERLGRAQQGYQAFLGRPASSRKIPGTTAYQGGVSRVQIVRFKETSRYVTVRTRNFQILVLGTSGFSNLLAVSAT